MTTVVIDDATRDRLRAGDSVFLTDETGAIVGEARATPLDSSRFLSRWFTDEEVAASLADPRRYSAAEVEQRLRELRK